MGAAKDVQQGALLAAADVCVPRRSEDEEEGDFFYDEEEVLAGADGEARAAMLDHYDSLLDMPRADQLDEVLLTHVAWPR